MHELHVRIHMRWCAAKIVHHADRAFLSLNSDFNPRALYHTAYRSRPNSVLMNHPSVAAYSHACS